MKDITVDREGNLRCWNCGQMAFTEKRTFRAKVIGVTAGVATLGVAGAAAPLLTKKKLKCQVCSEYNDTGSAKPFYAPSNRKWRKQMEQSGELARLAGAPAPEPEPIKPPAPPQPTLGLGGGLRLPGR